MPQFHATRKAPQRCGAFSWAVARLRGARRSAPHRLPGGTTRSYHPWDRCTARLSLAPLMGGVWCHGGMVHEASKRAGDFLRCAAMFSRARRKCRRAVLKPRVTLRIRSCTGACNASRSRDGCKLAAAASQLILACHGRLRRHHVLDPPRAGRQMQARDRVFARLYSKTDVFALIS